jgi:hypothetical protein
MLEKPVMKKPALLLLALGACSSSSGLPFTANTNLATYPENLPDGGPDPSFLLVGLAHIDQGPVDCAASFDGGFTVTGESVGIAVLNLDGGPVTSGTYPIVLNLPDSDGGVVAAVEQSDTDAGLTYAALSGTVTLTAVGSTISGSVDAQMAQLLPGTNRYQLSTSFSTPLCLP